MGTSRGLELLLSCNSIMPKTRSGTPPQTTQKKSIRTHPSAVKAKARSSARAKQLVEALLKEMQQGVRDPHYRESEDWVKLFGSKDSLVMNLQKLVATLAALPDDEVVVKPHQAATEAISQAEMALLKAWMEETSG